MKIVELKNGKFALLQSNNCKALTVKNGEVLFELDSVHDFIDRNWHSCIRGGYVNDYVKVITDAVKYKGIQSWLTYDLKVQKISIYQYIVTKLINDFGVECISQTYSKIHSGIYFAINLLINNKVVILSGNDRSNSISIWVNGDRLIFLHKYNETSELEEILKETILKIKG